MPVLLDASDEGAQSIAITTRKLRNWVVYTRRGFAAHEGGVNCDLVVGGHRVQIQNLIVRPDLSSSATLSGVVHLAQITVKLGRIHHHSSGLAHCLVD